VCVCVCLCVRERVAARVANSKKLSENHTDMYEAAAFSSCLTDSPSACTPHYGSQTSESEKRERE